MEDTFDGDEKFGSVGEIYGEGRGGRGRGLIGR